MTVFIENTHSTEETERVAAKFASVLISGDCVCLEGDLGAGKTAFVRGASDVLCPGVRIQSPTYTVMNKYKGKKNDVCHFDMYRITDEESLYSTGYFDIVESEVISFIEWSENIKEFLPEHRYIIKIEKQNNESCRKITCEKL